MTDLAPLGLLARGVPAGAANFGFARRRTVAEALRVAWDRVPAAERLGSSEPPLTTRLCHALNELANDPDNGTGFTRDGWETVVRGGEVASADGRSIEKRPDLCFRTVGQAPVAPDDFGLFVECKIVSKRHSVALYCDEGVMRYVKGHYAGAMADAMMVAYARDGATVPACLTPHLQADAERHYEVDELPTPTDSGDPDVFRSRHGRSWLRANAPIVIDHLWLSC